jgi:hypothetical protein
MKRVITLLALFAAQFAALPAAASAANVIYPATYTGTAATGGTVEFDVSADGTEIIRFALTKVPLPPCGTLTGQTPRKVPIINDSFSNTMGLMHFSGSFLTGGQAQGSMSFHRKDGTCDSQEVSWTASVPVPLPVEPAPEPPPAPVPPPPDETAPQTQITSGPSGVLHRRRATFRFSSTEAGSTFLCKLDAKAWRACEPAQVYRGLKEGRHFFRVKATDAAGNVDPTPAKRSWRVKT